MKKQEKTKKKFKDSRNKEEFSCDGYCPHCPKAKEEGILDPDFDIGEEDLKR